VELNFPQCDADYTRPRAMSIRVCSVANLEAPMSTSVNVNEPLRPQVRTRGFTGGVTRAAMGLLIAVGLGLVGTIYLNSLVGPADLIAFASAATD
jgi:hypothetical protein